MLTQGGDVMWRPSDLARRKTEMNISENNEETNENLIEWSWAGYIRRFFNNALLFIDWLWPYLNVLNIIE